LVELLTTFSKMEIGMEKSHTFPTKVLTDVICPLSLIYSLRLGGKIEAIEIHDLIPRSHEVAYEGLLRVVRRVDFRDGSKLGV